MNLELEQIVSDDTSTDPPEHKETLSLISKNSPISIGVLLGSLGIVFMFLALIAGIVGAVMADRTQVATELTRMRTVLESVDYEVKKINGAVAETKREQQELKNTVRDVRFDLELLKRNIVNYAESTE